MKKSITVFIMIGILIFFIAYLDISIQRSQKDEGQCEVVGKVIETNDDDLIISGVVMLGTQKLKVKIVRGQYKGQQIGVTNALMGQYEYDQFYKVGDKLLLGGRIKEGVLTEAVAIDYYRQNYVIILFGILALFLVIYAGKVGVRALFSFIISVLIIWLVLIPLLLKGVPAVPITLVTLVLLSAIIIFSVAGFTSKGYSAFFGTIAGIFVPVLLAYIFGKCMRIEGLTAPFAISILMRGYGHLNLQAILFSAILLGASGACMDIAMDVAASMEEIQLKKPKIKRKALVQSGMHIGQAVIGTMTTTLLLAYAGSFLTLMMMFKISETTLIRLLNMKIFTTEVLRILIGSLALLLVAPFTAYISGYILTRQKSKPVAKR